jgi:hypothetical protein
MTPSTESNKRNDDTENSVATHMQLIIRLITIHKVNNKSPIPRVTRAGGPAPLQRRQSGNQNYSLLAPILHQRSPCWRYTKSNVGRHLCWPSLIWGFLLSKGLGWQKLDVPQLVLPSTWREVVVSIDILVKMPPLTLSPIMSVNPPKSLEGDHRAA